METTLQDSIRRVETFLAQYMIIASVSTDEYISGYRSKTRLIVITIIRCFVLLNAIRYGLSAIINKVG